MTTNNLGNTNIYANVTEDGLSLAYQYLDSFFDNPVGIETAFGTNYNQGVANQLFTAFTQGDFSEIPEVKILSDEVLGATNGGYSAETNEIYLNERFLAENVDNTEAVATVLIEEIGHFIDAQINTEDSQGDEGDIFARLVQGETLNTETLAQLKAEDDSKTIVLEGEEIAIEQNNNVIYATNSADTLSSYTVGTGGNDDIRGDLSPSTIIIFENSNKGGRVQYLQEGYHNVDDLTIGNDKLSSLELNRGYRVTLYEHSNFTGDSRVITEQNVGNLKDLGFNDKTSSIRVEYLGSNDTFYGGAGNDTIDGGFGYDTVVAGGNYSEFDITFVNDNYVRIHDTYSQNGDQGTDRLSGIERITFFDGSYDVVTGTSSNDNIRGGAGRSLLFGGSLNDNLDGGAGDDAIDGGFGYDTVVAGGSFLEFETRFLNDGSILIHDTSSQNGDQGTDILSGIERINFFDDRRPTFDRMFLNDFSAGQETKAEKNEN